MTRSEASRQNGAKSRGPVTPAGKQRSSANRLRHGLTAETVLLPGESRFRFNALLNCYLERFSPADPLETAVVHDLAFSHWRLLRIFGTENVLIAEEMAFQAKFADEPISAAVQKARAFRCLADQSQSLGLIQRYESRLRRALAHTLDTLRVLQAGRPGPPDDNKTSTDEPEPSPDPAGPGSGPSQMSSQAPIPGAHTPPEPIFNAIPADLNQRLKTEPGPQSMPPGPGSQCPQAFAPQHPTVPLKSEFVIVESKSGADKKLPNDPEPAARGPRSQASGCAAPSPLPAPLQDPNQSQLASSAAASRVLPPC